MIFRRIGIAVSDKRQVNLNSRCNAGRGQGNILPENTGVRTWGNDAGDFQAARVLKSVWHCDKTTERSRGRGPVIWERGPLGWGSWSVVNPILIYLAFRWRDRY